MSRHFDDLDAVLESDSLDDFRQLIFALQSPPCFGGGVDEFHTLVKADLLILDDWGPERLTANQRRDLMEIVEDRYGRGSTLITSQLPLDKWHEVVGDPTFADAILDRIVHNAYRLELDGPSMRKLKAAEQNEPEARTTKQVASGTSSPATKPAKGD